MIYISHRGNVYGPNPIKENSPEYIMEALNQGFDVEVDVWFKEGSFWLGHDFPQYKTDFKFLVNERLWCHAKNIESLLEMKKYVIHYFWHETDKVTLTSKNYIWAYPTNNLIQQSIAVIPEFEKKDLTKIKGLCSDYIGLYKNEY